MAQRDSGFRSVKIMSSKPVNPLLNPGKSKSSGYQNQNQLEMQNMAEDTTDIGVSEHSVSAETLDHVIEGLRIGKFHFQLLTLCGLSFMSDAMEVTLLAFLSICAGVEWNLADSQIASITSAVFAGQIIGGLFWGPFADIYGRRKSLASGFSPNYTFLLAMRMIVGFGVGGLTVPFDLLAEFIPARVRGEYCLKMSYFWTLGSIFVAGMAWLILTHMGWRALTISSCIPVMFTLIISFFFLPESPRWLLEQGRVNEAEDVLQQAMRINKEDNAHISVKLKPLTHHFKLYLNLLKAEHIGYSMPLWAAWFTFGFCYYGVILLISRMYNSGSDLSNLVCDFNYAPIFINASAELVGLFSSIQVIDSWGRPKVMFITYGLSAVTALFIGVKNTSTGILVVGCLARAAAVAANCTTWVCTPELYKTDVRATGHASCNAWTRVGAFIVPFVVQSKLSTFTVGCIIGGVNCIGVVVSLLVPSMIGRDIDNPDYDIASGEKVNPLDYFLFGGAPREFFRSFLPRACIK
eukprot:GSChrysophyteH1.ASY1.ANO1.2032.1 assembled CDS